MLVDIQNSFTIRFIFKYLTTPKACRYNAHKTEVLEVKWFHCFQLLMVSTLISSIVSYRICDCGKVGVNRSDTCWSWDELNGMYYYDTVLLLLPVLLQNNNNKIYTAPHGCHFRDTGNSAAAACHLWRVVSNIAHPDFWNRSLPHSFRQTKNKQRKTHVLDGQFYLKACSNEVSLSHFIQKQPSISSFQN